MSSIILIGFMGAGKRTTGTLLAEMTGLPFADTDQLIEQRAGMSISGIFAEQGEEAFRKQETELLLALLKEKQEQILSCGGGLPLREENRALLKQLGTVIYLSVQPETVQKRLKGDTTRPLLQGEDAEEKIRTLLGKREDLYEAAADIVIPVDALTLEEAAEQICRAAAKKMKK